MRRANHSLAISLCTSLVVHGLALSALAWWFVRHGEPTRLAGPTPAEVFRATAPPPVPPPAARKRRPRPPPTPFTDPPRIKDDSGEANGHGTANRSTAGDRPMEASQGYEQANLVRSAVADSSLIDPAADRAAQAGKATPEDALPLQTTAPQRGSYRPDFVAESRAAADPAGEVAPKPAAAHGLGPLPPSSVLAVPPEVALPPAPTGVRDAVAHASPAVTAPPVPRKLRGRRAVASDTESPAFAPSNSVTFHDGRVDGRAGMKVQLYSPRFGLASEDDLSAMGTLHAEFGVHVRADGSVSYVEPIKTSGSPNVDEDCTRALYAGTFEPQKDKEGHPVETLWRVVYD